MTAPGDSPSAPPASAPSPTRASRPDQLNPDRALLLVIDMQEKILPLVHRPGRVVEAVRKMILAANVLGVPMLATEQYPKGLGHTEPTLRELLQQLRVTRMEKPAFSCWKEATIRAAIERLNCCQILVCGIETHVCVQQTALDLLATQFQCFVLADAVSSRGRENHVVALDRMRHAGAAITTVEAAMFELCQRTDDPRFKPMLEIIKAFPPTDE